LNNYNPIAKSYDFLSKKIFGNTLMDAQTALLPYIPAGARVLVVGGGTGKILEAMAALHPDGLHITYVEISSKMVELARKRNVGKNHIRFVRQPIEEFTFDGNFNIIITPFLFDNFGEEKARSIFEKLHTWLAPHGLWLHTDFVDDKNTKRKHKLLLKVMYLFFRIVSRVEARRLVDMRPLFPGRYGVLFEKRFYSGFVYSAVYVNGIGY